MKLSELITKLQSLQNKQGDPYIAKYLYRDSKIEPLDINFWLFEKDGEKFLIQKQNL